MVWLEPVSIFDRIKTGDQSIYYRAELYLNAQFKYNGQSVGDGPKETKPPKMFSKAHPLILSPQKKI